jgi:protein-S-isoprenylcysteine O-methyltransferase Ste14
VLTIAAGSALLLWCVREFYVSGKGTLAPWSPPRHLVTGGLYRVSRNPMYVAVATVLIGWSLWFASGVLAIYAVVVVVLFHLRVQLYEEPVLAASFGEEWYRYRARVRRWL